MTQEQRENLKTLAAYLLSGKLKAEFNMKNYTDNPTDFYAPICGSIGCAVGHGPYAGIPKKDRERWDAYVHRVFGVEVFEYKINTIFSWLFGGGWIYHDNTPEGAAKRIIYYLKNGVVHGGRDRKIYEHLSLADLEK